MYRVPGPTALRLLATALLLVPFLAVPSAHAAQPVRAVHPVRTVPASARAVSARRPALVFDEEFGAARWGRRGAVWSDRTTAYPDGFSDPGNAKLDRVQPAAMTVSGGLLHLTATAGTARGPWRTGLLTTEPWHGGVLGGDGFQLRTGDYAVVRLRLPSRQDGGGHGAWPGVWTWRGGNEVDLMEWHSETPDIIELTNHARGAGSQACVHSPLVNFGRWITVGVRFGATAVSWYLGDDSHPLRPATQDRLGVGPSWHAYLIANLSVSAQPGRFPTATRPITMAIDRIQVYR